MPTPTLMSAITGQMLVAGAATSTEDGCGAGAVPDDGLAMPIDHGRRQLLVGAPGQPSFLVGPDGVRVLSR